MREKSTSLETASGGVFDTTLKTDVDDLFSRAAEVNSMMKVLRYKMEKKDYKTPVKAGIGLSYGRALMIKAGYNGSGISDVVYMGDVVNQAAKLAAQGSKGWNQPIYADGVFYQNLNEYNQGLLKQITWGGPYSGWVVNIAMENWYTENCK
jgi:class 3 adenylate cyclase